MSYTHFTERVSDQRVIDEIRALGTHGGAEGHAGIVSEAELSHINLCILKSDYVQNKLKMNSSLSAFLNLVTPLQTRSFFLPERAKNEERKKKKRQRCNTDMANSQRNDPVTLASGSI